MAIEGDKLIEILQNTGVDGMQVRSYSGRFMYGKECVAVTVDGATDLAVVADMFRAASYLYDGDELRETIDDLADMIDGTRTDSMGLGTVIYWPSVEWSDHWEMAFSQDDEE